MGAKFELLAIFLFFNVFFSESHLVAKTCGYLPYGRRYAAAVYDGDDGIYFIGGETRFESDDHYFDEIVRLSVTYKTSEVVGTLPIGLSSGTATMDNMGNIFFFGGYNDRNLHPAIYKIPIEDHVPIHVNNLRPNTTTPSVVSVNGGAQIYLIGGSTSEITLYDPAANTLEVVDHLPQEISGATLTYDGEHIFIFGGYDGTDVTYGITKYDPVTQSQEVIDTILTSSPATGSFTGNQSTMLFGYDYESSEEFYEFSKFHHETQDLEKLVIDIDMASMTGPVSAYVPKNNNFYFNGGVGLPPYAATVYCIDLTHG